MIASAGVMSMLASFPLSFLFPDHQPAVLAAISCLFDCSSVIFQVFLLVVESTQISLKELLLGYAAFSVVLNAALVILWYGVDLGVEENEGKEGGNNDEESALSYGSGVVENVPVHKRTLGQQLKSFEFFTILTFASLQMLRCNTYLG